LSEFDTRFLSLLADVVTNPRFAAEDLEKVRANKLRELTINRAAPGSIAWERFRSVVFAGHAYSSIYPTEAGLRAYTLQDVKTFYFNQFGAARTHLYIAGQFDAAKVRSAVEKAFGKWKKGPEPIRNVPRVAGKRSFDLIDRPGSPQSTIYLGVPAMSPSDPDFIKFTVLDSLLGSSFGSRITANIRENKGYTYSPNSFIWHRYRTGYWIENADVTTEHTGASIKEILFEIDRLKKEPPSAAELQGIKNYLVGIYVLNNSTRAGVIGQLENANYNELPKDYISTYIQKLASVTPAEVSEMAKKYLVSEKMAIVVVGDKAKVESQLKPYSN
jgi:predicted Zn-dependent peptidase